MSITRSEKKYLLLSSNSITLNNDEMIEISSKCAIASQPIDIINRIAKEFKGDYQPLAKLSQTSKIMKKLIEQTEDGQKVASIHQLQPNALREWFANSEKVNIDAFVFYGASIGLLLSIGCSFTLFFKFMRADPGPIGPLVSVASGVIGGSVSGYSVFKGLHANRNNVNECHEEIKKIKNELILSSGR